MSAVSQARVDRVMRDLGFSELSARRHVESQDRVRRIAAERHQKALREALEAWRAQTPAEPTKEA